MALIPTPTSRMALGLSYGLLVACSPSPSGGSGGTGTQDEGTAGTVSDGTGSEESGEEGGSETGVDNAAPSVPIGLSPGEGEVVESPISLCWAPSIDPEGDPIAYRVELGGMPLGEPSTAICTEALELTPGQSFSWRVQAFDPTRAEHSSP